MASRPIIGTYNGSLNSTVVNCQGNICQCLADKIADLLNNVTTHKNGTKGLKQLFAEQVQKGGSGPGTNVWNVHDQKFRTQQNTLRAHLDEFDAQGCGGGTPIPSDARAWASRPAPTADDWQAHQYQGVTGSVAGDVAAGAGAVGAGYLIYRGIRLIPSIFFPPSFIPNLAIP